MASTTRITGMYSGLDTDALIEEMLAANKTPLNNYQREKTEVEWQRETLIDLNSQLLEFQNLANDMQKENSFKVYTTESTNSRIATASATTEALEGTYTIKTHQLATSTTYVSSPVSTNPKITSIKSGDIDWNTSFANTSFNITLNGETKTISFGATEGIFNENSTPKEITSAFQKKIDDAFGANQIEVYFDDLLDYYTLEFKSGPDALQLPISVTSGGEAAGTTDTLAALGIDSGTSNVFDTSVTIASFLKKNSQSTMTFTINGHTETISTQTTISDFFKKINNLDLDVNIKYDSLSDAIIMKRNSSGAGREIEVDDSLDLFKALGFNNKATYKSGQNARVSIIDPEGREKLCKEVQKKDEDGTLIFDKDGNPVMEWTGGLELTSNSFTYEGVNFNLNKAAPDDEVSITVAKDVDKVFDNVLKFVDKYNTILGKLNELYNEKPNRDYDPLLDEERDELTDSQQEKWDKLARQGLLYRDSTLQTTIASMRSAVTNVLSNNSDISSLFQIGISTTKYSSTGSDNGKLIVDEEKLKEAISNNMDEVAALFTNKPDYITGTVIDTANTIITEGSSFKITVGGKEETITFDRDYDLSDSTAKGELVSNINTILASKFGTKNIVFAISSDRVVISSQKGNTVTLNSGDGNDALASLGLEDGVKYDSSALGFANKIANIMDIAQTDITNKAGTNATTEDESTLGERMSQLNNYISRQKDRLEILEDRYYSQFSAMETALAQMESQSSYLTSMLSGSGM